MNKVYVTQETVRRDNNTGARVPRFDITPATVYGELEYLTPEGNISFAPAPIIKTLKEKLRNFTDDDYILPVGDPILIAMATMIAADMNMGKVKMLKWDKHIGSYIVINIDKGV